MKLRFVTMLAIAVAAFFMGTTPALSHAALTAINPADGATLKQPPTKITLTFNEPIGKKFAAVKVTGPEGEIGEGEPDVDGNTVTQAVMSDPPAGKYKVAFRVVSEDGHTVSDSTTFTLAAAATSTATASPSSSAPSSAPSPSATVAGDATESGEAGGRTGRIVAAFGVAAIAIAAGLALQLRRRREGVGGEH